MRGMNSGATAEIPLRVITLSDLDQPLRLWSGNRIEQNCVDDAIDRRGSPDAQGEGDDRQGAKAGVPQKEPQCVAKILHETLDRTVPTASRPSRFRPLTALGIAWSCILSMLPFPCPKGLQWYEAA